MMYLVTGNDLKSTLSSKAAILGDLTYNSNQDNSQKAEREHDVHTTEYEGKNKDQILASNNITHK